MFGNDKRKIYKIAMQIALTEDVSSNPDSVVVYSITNQLTSQNRDNAHAFVSENPGKVTLDHVPCGERLNKLGLGPDKIHLFDSDKIRNIWNTASKRFMEEAKGNIVAFVEGADEKSTFLTVELPEILKNPNIKTINGMDKHQFYEETFI